MILFLLVLWCFLGPLVFGYVHFFWNIENERKWWVLFVLSGPGVWLISLGFLCSVIIKDWAEK